MLLPLHSPPCFLQSVEAQSPTLPDSSLHTSCSLASSSVHSPHKRSNDRVLWCLFFCCSSQHRCRSCRTCCYRSKGENKTAYLNVCDNTSYALCAKSLTNEALAANVPAITTGGIYPGVSNVMAAELVRDVKIENKDSTTTQ